MSIVVNSFPYLCGRTVQVALGGLDCGDIAVAADGSLTIPFGSDDQGLLTAAYLMSISSPGSYGDAEVALTFTDAEANVMTANVPLVVGYGYTAQAQRLRPDGDELKSPSGQGIGKQRKGKGWAMLLTLAGAFNVGTMFDKLLPVRLTKTDRVSVLAASTGYTGVLEGTLKDDHGFDTMLAWEITRPVPFVVASANTFVEGQER
jgi:hypothetical protein